MEELYSLDQDQFERLKPVHGLIFLFKWVADEDPAGTVVKDSRADSMFFAKQVINNACATQAILSVLLNAQHEELTLGDTLTSFKEFCSSFDSTMKGLTLSNSDEIRTVHNSFARQSVFEYDAKAATKDDDVFHFVGYVPVNGRLYELDGLKEGPMDHGAIPEGGDWLDVARPVLSARMAKYQAGEIHFNLMALVQDKLMRYDKEMKALAVSLILRYISQINTFYARLFLFQAVNDSTGLAELELRVAEEKERRNVWKKENIRRRHNYMPFIVEMLKGLANEGKLMEVYERAKERAIEQEKVKQRRKEQQEGSKA